LGDELATEVIDDANNVEVGGTRYYYDLSGNTTETLDGYDASTGNFLKKVLDQYAGAELTTEVVDDASNVEVGGTRYYYDLAGETTQTLDGFNVATGQFVKRISASYDGGQLQTEVVSAQAGQEIGFHSYLYDLEGNTTQTTDG